MRLPIVVSPFWMFLLQNVHIYEGTMHGKNSAYAIIILFRFLIWNLLTVEL